MTRFLPLWQAQQPVTNWVYDGSLKVEYQAILFSQYTIELQEDSGQLRSTHDDGND